MYTINILSYLRKYLYIDFEITWEQRKLGEISEISIGEFVIQTKQSNKFSYPVYNGGISYTGLYNEYNFDGHFILVSARGANAGFVNYHSGKFWLGNSCYAIKVENNYNSKFVYFYMKYNEHLFTKFQQAANIPSVSKKAVFKFDINFPRQEEQYCIENLFNNLEKLITLHQRNLFFPVKIFNISHIL